MNLMEGSQTWQQHKAALDALMGQYGVNPMPVASSAPAPSATPQASPSFSSGSIFSNPSTTDTSLWQYLNGLNAQQTGLGPTGENVSPMGAWYGADGQRMPEFGMSGYGGGAPASFSGFGDMNIPGWATGLLGAGIGTVLGGPFGGLLGGVAGRAIPGLFGPGGLFGGDGMVSGSALDALGSQANQNAQNMSGTSQEFGDGRGL